MGYGEHPPDSLSFQTLVVSSNEQDLRRPPQPHRRFGSGMRPFCHGSCPRITTLVLSPYRGASSGRGRFEEPENVVEAAKAGRGLNMVIGRGMPRLVCLIRSNSSGSVNVRRAIGGEGKARRRGVPEGTSRRSNEESRRRGPARVARNFWASALVGRIRDPLHKFAYNSS